MKVKNILIGIAAALAAVSCNVEDEAVLPGAASDGLLKIRPRLQQLDVQTRNAENALIAYIPDSLKSARVQPIASSMIRENVYYYNLPEAATSVLFTNLASTAEENVRFGLEETGGLMDTVHPYEAWCGAGNGFTFAAYNSGDMAYVIRQAVDLYHNNRDAFKRLQLTGMTSDFSWDKSAQEYNRIYEMIRS